MSIIAISLVALTVSGVAVATTEKMTKTKEKERNKMKCDKMVEKVKECDLQDQLDINFALGLTAVKAITAFRGSDNKNIMVNTLDYSLGEIYKEVLDDNGGIKEEFKELTSVIKYMEATLKKNRRV